MEEKIKATTPIKGMIAQILKEFIIQFRDIISKIIVCKTKRFL